MKVKPSSIEEMSPAQLAHWCPNLKQDKYTKTSEATNFYNCVNWAIGINNRWKDFYYLPNGEVNDDLSSEPYIRYFSKNGFKQCEDGEFEEGKNKIAIYENNRGHFTHVALQISENEWTSKLGEFEDISHIDLHCLEGSGNTDRYGRAVFFMEKNV